MSERALEPTHTPADYLGVLQDYLTDTRGAVQSQLEWLRMGAKFLGPEKSAQVDMAITAQIAANVAQASSYIRTLGERGMSVIVVSPEGQRLPLLGLGFEPTTGLYEAGVPTPQGSALLPLGESVQLDIYPNY